MESKKGDFVEFDFTGIVRDTKDVFDTTIEKTAKENGLWSEGLELGPKVVCLGEQQIVLGLEKNLEGKEPGKEYTFRLTAEEGFGKKNAKLIQLIPTIKFTKENIRPEVGLQVSIDNDVGIIKAVTGGRTLVDFNHPLSGKELVYEVKIRRIITDPAEKIKAIIKNELGQDSDVIIAEKMASVKLKKKLPSGIEKVIEGRITATVKEITAVKFEGQP